MVKPPKSPRSAKGRAALQLNAVRQVHVYVSILVAPMLVFWSVTGALQVFRIPDREPNSVLFKLASVHRNSTYAGKVVKAGPAAPNPGADHGPKGAPSPAPPKAQVAPATTALKWYFAVASIALTVSTLLGAWMGLAHHRRKTLMWALLAGGSAIPVGLLMLAPG